MLAMNYLPPVLVSLPNSPYKSAKEFAEVQLKLKILQSFQFNNEGKIFTSLDIKSNLFAFTSKFLERRKKTYS